VASKNGSRIAWVFDAKGVRNVWLADGPDFVHTARPLTHYKTDDGQPIASLRLTPDGKTALYALGSELNEAARTTPHANVAKLAPRLKYRATAAGQWPTNSTMPTASGIRIVATRVAARTCSLTVAPSRLAGPS